MGRRVLADPGRLTGPVRHELIQAAQLGDSAASRVDYAEFRLRRCDASGVGRPPVASRLAALAGPDDAGRQSREGRTRPASRTFGRIDRFGPRSTIGDLAGRRFAGLAHDADDQLFNGLERPGRRGASRGRRRKFATARGSHDLRRARIAASRTANASRTPSSSPFSKPSPACALPRRFRVVGSWLRMEALRRLKTALATLCGDTIFEPVSGRFDRSSRT